MLPSFPTPTHHVHLAEVEADPMTGEVHPLRYAVAQEVGRVIDPDGVYGQVMGAVTQGIGYALYESLQIGDDGRYRERTLESYRLPLAVDVPRVEFVALEHPDPDGPGGAKGVAEGPVLLPAAVIANAVGDTIGRPVDNVPITVEAVLAAIQDRARRRRDYHPGRRREANDVDDIAGCHRGWPANGGPFRPLLGATGAYAAHRALAKNRSFRGVAAFLRRHRRLSRWFTAAERVTKEVLFGCRMCGQWALPTTGLRLPDDMPEAAAERSVRWGLTVRCLRGGAGAAVRVGRGARARGVRRAKWDLALEHVIAAKATAFRLAATPAFVDRQGRTLRGARTLAQRLLERDVAVAGISLVSGGTDVHLVLVDLRAGALDGRQAEDRLAATGITVNRNAVRFGPRPPMVTSGLRIGTAALAARGAGDPSSPRSAM